MECSSRVRAYIDNVMLAIDRLEKSGVAGRFPRLVEAARLYAGDAEYYLEEKGDCFTALACIAYAEGLLDSLRYLGLASVEWEPLSRLVARPRVVVAGGFEIIHPGHIHYLREAWRLGRVYAIVARDESFRRFKGRDPVVGEEQRLRVLEAIRYVYKAVLGDKRDFLRPLEEIGPDIILLGPDQWPDEGRLERMLEERGLRGVRVLRLRERVNGSLYSASRIIRVVIERYCGGKASLSQGTA